MTVVNKTGIVNKIGLEAEFILKNSKGEMVIPPATWDRDGFPLLGEIRGAEADTAGKAVSNFFEKKLEIFSKLKAGHSMNFSPMEICPLALYKKANKEIDVQEKVDSMGKVKNLHGIDIEEYSDQVLKDNKIQGVRVSCGLHIHFSSEERKEAVYNKEVYEQMSIPLGTSLAQHDANFEKYAGKLMHTHLSVHKYLRLEEKLKLECRASRLNKPAIEYIVNAMDKEFFETFAPKKGDRTKFRQPGFFELKPWGFEYRSLPMSNDIEASLFKIATFALGLLDDINQY